MFGLEQSLRVSGSEDDGQGLGSPSSLKVLKKVGKRLPGEGNSNTHGARPVH